MEQQPITLCRHKWVVQDTFGGHLFQVKDLNLFRLLNRKMFRIKYCIGCRKADIQEL